MSDRIKIQRKKATISTYTQPSLAQKSTQGFGLSSSSPSQSIASPQSHDISRISLRPQAKLTVSQPGDKYEQEADNVAEQVMGMAVPETLEFSNVQTPQNSLQTNQQQPNQQLDLAKINADADALFKAIDGWGTDEDTILKILANKTPAEIAAIKQAYIDHYGRNLDQDLVSEMSGDDLKEAQTKLSGDKAQAAIEALNNSIGFFNDDEAKIEETLSALSPEDLKQMKQMAEKDPAVKAKLDNVLDYLGGEDKEVTEALLEGDKEKAAAARIAEAIEGLGTDEKAVYK